MLYVLNGGAPEKLNLFLNRNDVTLLDNNGDDSNAKNFEELLINEKLNEKSDYILITSENQRYYLDEHKELYNKYRNNIICLKNKYGNDFELSDKGIIANIKGQERKQICGRVEDLQKIDIEKELGEKEYIVKPCNGSGSRGIKCTIDLGIFKGTKLPLFSKDFEPTEKVIIESIFSQEEYASVTVPTVIKDNKILAVIPILSGDYYQGQARWKTIILDTVHFNQIYNIINNIIEQLNISDGIFEPEIMIKLNNDKSLDFSKWNIIDLNPRWSLDCSTCSNLVIQSFNIFYFNLADIYISNNNEWIDIFKNSKVFDTYILTDYYIKLELNNFRYNKFKKFTI